jgi:quercetin dioxygenase-like cupin family protein
MERVVRRLAGLIAANVAMLLFLSAATAGGNDKSAAGFEVKPVLKTTETNVGGPLAYPGAGKPELSSAIVTIQPGGRSNLHQHPVVTFVYVLEGEADLRVGEQVFHYKAGDAWVEPIDTLNQIFNVGTVPLRNLVVFVGSEGNPNAVAAE